MTRKTSSAGLKPFMVTLVGSALIAACNSTPTPVQGPGMRWIGPDQGGSADALLTGFLILDDDCIEITDGETSDTYGLVLAPGIDTTAGVVDSSTGAPLENGATVSAGGGEMPVGTGEEGDEVATPSPDCLTGKYFYTASLTMAP
jgi:hypothetical protein